MVDQYFMKNKLVIFHFSYKHFLQIKLLPRSRSETSNADFLDMKCEEGHFTSSGTFLMARKGEAHGTQWAIFQLKWILWSTFPFGGFSPPLHHTHTSCSYIYILKKSSEYFKTRDKTVITSPFQ